MFTSFRQFSRKPALQAPGIAAVQSAVAALLLTVTWLPLPSQAATTLNVTTTNSVEAVDGQCSLPEAVRAARTNTTVNECFAAGGPPFTINLQANTVYGLATSHVDIPLGVFPSLGFSALMIDANEVTINGNGATLRQAVPEQRVLQVSGGNVTLRNLRIMGGTATNTSVGYSAWGGGIIVAHAGTVLSLEDVTVSGNDASTDGAAILAVDGAVLNIHRSTIANNTSINVAAGSQIRIGLGAHLNFANSTLDGDIRGVAITDNATALASNVTIRALSAFGVVTTDTSTIQVQNSIVGESCSGVGGTYSNVAASTSACAAVMPSPVLSPLAANGGITQTMLPGLPTTVKDAAPGCTYLSSGTNPLFSNGAAITTDQRGFARDANCDLGAVELLTISPSSLPATSAGSAYSAIITQTGGGSPATFAVTAGALPPGLSLNAGTGALTGTPSTVGSYDFTVTVTDSGGFRTSIRYSVSVARGVQTLTLGAQAAQTYVAGGSFAINPVATTNAGAPGIEHSSLTPAVCTVSGTTVTMVAAGTCTLRASHVGNSNYEPAVSGTQNVIINPGAQTITFATPASRPLNSAPFVVAPTGGASGNPVVVTSLTPTRCTASGVNGTTITLLASGTCTLQANQAGNASYTAAPAVTVSFGIGVTPTDVQLSAPTAVTAFGQPARFDVLVTGAAVTGTVTVLSGIETVCANLPIESGRATCTTSTLAEGGHAIRAYYSGDSNNAPAFSPERVHEVSRKSFYQGAWWAGPSENGWGLSIMEHGDVLVAGWYFYDDAGNPTWLIVPGCAWNTARTSCTGPLMRSTGSWFGDYRSQALTRTTVGSATLAFDDPNRATFTYTVNGVAGSKVISRLSLGPNPFQPFDYTDIWWGGPAQDGWGVAVYVAGQSLAGVWYTYDTAGEPTWYLFNGGLQVNPITFRSTLLRSRGSPMIGTAYQASALQQREVGEVYFQFEDVRNGEFSYRIDGLVQGKPFRRVPF